MLSAGVYTLRQQNGTTLTFNAQGNLASIEDASGNTITAHYTGGLLTSLVSSDAQLTIAYNAAGRIDQITENPGAQVTTYTYDATGQLLMSVTGPKGTTSYTYVTGQAMTQQYALASITFPGGTHQYYSYDSQGRLTRVYGDGTTKATQYAYVSAGGVAMTDAAGATTTIYYNEFGQPGLLVNSQNHVLQYQYGANQQLIGLSNGNGTAVAYANPGAAPPAVQPLDGADWLDALLNSTPDHDPDEVTVGMVPPLGDCTDCELALEAVVQDIIDEQNAWGSVELTWEGYHDAAVGAAGLILSDVAIAGATLAIFAPVVETVLTILEVLETTFPTLVETVSTLKDVYDVGSAVLTGLANELGAGSADQAQSETNDAVAQWSDNASTFATAEELLLKAVDLPGIAKYFGIAGKVATAINYLDKAYNFINAQLNQVADALDTLVTAEGSYNQAVSAYEDSVAQAQDDLSSYQFCLDTCAEDNGGEGSDPSGPDDGDAGDTGGDGGLGEPGDEGGGGGGAFSAPVPYGDQPVDT
jgi:YD repeat-containing protein